LSEEQKATKRKLGGFFSSEPVQGFLALVAVASDLVEALGL
jgi:hypothetical protein